MMDTLIHEVWANNLEEELLKINYYLNDFNVISLDAEFPGFLRQTSRNASDSVCYEDLQFNVNSMKLLQLGLTLSDSCGNICSTWELNFCDFDAKTDAHVGEAVSFLKKNGLEFDRLRNEGILLHDFATRFIHILNAHRSVRWVTFHGLYDIGYLLKLLTMKDLPDSAQEFATMAARVFGPVYDLKFMARYCDGLRGRNLGLQKLAQILGVQRIGGAHQAGSDSLLTAAAYSRMQTKFHISKSKCEGYLYGLVSYRISPMRSPMVAAFRPPRGYYCHLLTFPNSLEAIFYIFIALIFLYLLALPYY